MLLVLHITAQSFLELLSPRTVICKTVRYGQRAFSCIVPSHWSFREPSAVLSLPIGASESLQLYCPFPLELQRAFSCIVPSHWSFREPSAVLSLPTGASESLQLYCPFPLELQRAFSCIVPSHWSFREPSAVSSLPIGASESLQLYRPFPLELQRAFSCIVPSHWSFREPSAVLSLPIGASESLQLYRPFPLELQLYRPFPLECPAQEHHGDRLFILSSLLSRHTSLTVAPNCPVHIISTLCCVFLCGSHLLCFFWYACMKMYASLSLAPVP